MITASTMDFGTAKHANFVIHNGAKMISVAVDNSGGAMNSMARSDIRLLFTDPLDGGVKDITNDIFGGPDGSVIQGNADNMDKAMKWLQLSSWGFCQ